MKFRFSLFSLLIAVFAASCILYLNTIPQDRGGIWGSVGEGYDDMRYTGMGWPFADAIQKPLIDPIGSLATYSKGDFSKGILNSRLNPYRKVHVVYEYKLICVNALIGLILVLGITLLTEKTYHGIRSRYFRQI